MNPIIILFAWLHAENPDAAPYAVILEDRRTLVDPLVFRGGRAAAKGDAVPRQFLEVLADSARRPFSRGSGRLELAEAVTDPANPLTPRVWVNRLWLHHFGAGLVTTPSDFGVRAAAPSHPELLDWLATRLRAERAGTTGWRRVEVWQTGPAAARTAGHHFQRASVHSCVAFPATRVAAA